MRQVRWYRILSLVCLVAAGADAVLVAVALALAHVSEATAAALCGVLFFIPGILFLNQWRRLYVRDLALVHAASLADEAGVTNAKELAERLQVPQEDAAKILRIAIREGQLQGSVDDRGRFVSATAPHCAACGAPVPRSAVPGPCPSCGARTARGA